MSTDYLGAEPESYVPFTPADIGDEHAWVRTEPLGVLDRPPRWVATLLVLVPVVLWITLHDTTVLTATVLTATVLTANGAP